MDANASGPFPVRGPGIHFYIEFLPRNGSHERLHIRAEKGAHGLYTGLPQGQGINLQKLPERMLCHGLKYVLTLYHGTICTSKTPQVRKN